MQQLRLIFLGVMIGVAVPVIGAEQGKVYFDRLCAKCHGPEGKGRQDLEAPAIAGMPAWYVKDQLHKFRVGARGKHPQDIAGMRMRPMARTLKSEEEIEAVSQYVAALGVLSSKPTITGGRMVYGQKKFQQVCTACHGPDGRGMEAVKAPPLVGQSDWYLVSQLRHFQKGVRGFDPVLDPMGATMKPMAAQLDDQAVLDVVSYLNALQSSANNDTQIRGE